MPMKPVITAFADSPDRGRSLARDMRVRWALEEVGQAYDVRLLTFAQMRTPTHLALHPFAQIPTWEEDGLALFESGAIVLHIANQHAGLLPTDPSARARALQWVFAALNTLEPSIVEFEMARILEHEQPWFPHRQPMLEERVHTRLQQLSKHLADSNCLDGDFTAGDLLMVTVLRRLDGSGLLQQFPRLITYVARAEARPAYQRAFAAQRAVFDAKHAAR